METSSQSLKLDPFLFPDAEECPWPEGIPPREGFHYCVGEHRYMNLRERDGLMAIWIYFEDGKHGFTLRATALPVNTFQPALRKILDGLG